MKLSFNSASHQAFTTRSPLAANPDSVVETWRNALAVDASPPVVTLTPPRLNAENRGAEIACVRSMRRGGPRIETVRQDEQLITHAYGFGGAGWTLAPGATDMALACLESARRGQAEFYGQRVAVIGGGVIGVWVALALSQLPDLGRITVYGENFNDIATRNAGGVLKPVALGTEVDDSPALQAVAVSAFQTWAGIAQAHRMRPVRERGARFMPSYDPMGIPSSLGTYVRAQLIPEPTPVTVQFGAYEGPRYAMNRYDCIFMDVNVMQDEMRNLANMNGVRFKKERVSAFSSLDEKIVMNCAGLGAATLARDPAMVPVLGHLVALANQTTFGRQQYMCNGSVGGGTTYYIPKRRGIHSGVIGGTFMEGEGDTTASPQSFDDVWRRARMFFYGPRLTN